MLSRIAESFFWIGRHLERGEATARLLAEHHQLMVEDTRVPQELACDLLLDALGLEGPGVITASELVRRVLGDSGDAGTVAGSVSAARENARAIRDAVSGELFEALNAAYLALPRSLRRLSSPGVVLHGVLERLAVVAGVLDWTMPRDEALLFLRLGRSVERIDMTARLLAVRHDLGWPEGGPATTLRAAGGMHAFLRNGRPMTGAAVREFLMLDPVFPRSMLVQATLAEDTVRELDQVTGTGSSTSLLRTVGMLRSELEYSVAGVTPETVDDLATRALDAATAAGGEVDAAFFRQLGTVVWSH